VNSSSLTARARRDGQDRLARRRQTRSPQTSKSEGLPLGHGGRLPTGTTPRPRCRTRRSRANLSRRAAVADRLRRADRRLPRPRPSSGTRHVTYLSMYDVEAARPRDRPARVRTRPRKQSRSLTRSCAQRGSCRTSARASWSVNGHRSWFDRPTAAGGVRRRRGHRRRCPGDAPRAGSASNGARKRDHRARGRSPSRRQRDSWRGHRRDDPLTRTSTARPGPAVSPQTESPADYAECARLTETNRHRARRSPRTSSARVTWLRGQEASPTSPDTFAASRTSTRGG